MGQKLSLFRERAFKASETALVDGPQGWLIFEHGWLQAFSACIRVWKATVTRLSPLWRENWLIWTPRQLPWMLRSFSPWLQQMPPASMMSPLYVRTSSKDVFWLWCGLFSRVAPLQQAFQEERARLMGEINSVRGCGFARARLAVLLICVVNVVTDTC